MIEIVYSDILADVRSQISLLAKRAKAKDGSGLYEGISVSGVEGDTLKSYMEQAVSDALSEFVDFIDGATGSSTGISFNISNPRGFKMKDSSTSTFDDIFESALKGYVVAKTLYEYLSLTQSSLSQKYMSDCAVRMQALKNLVFFKGEPARPLIDYGNVGGSIIKS